MRSFERMYSHATPPVEGHSLVLDGETDTDRDAGFYRNIVSLSRRKRIETWKLFRNLACHPAREIPDALYKYLDA